MKLICKCGNQEKFSAMQEQRRKVTINIDGNIIEEHEVIDDGELYSITCVDCGEDISFL